MVAYPRIAPAAGTAKRAREEGGGAGTPVEGGHRGPGDEDAMEGDRRGGKRKRRNPKPNPKRRARIAEARRKGKAPAGLGAEESAAGEAQLGGGTRAAGEEHQEAGTSAAGRERHVVGRIGAGEHRQPGGISADGGARQGARTRVAVGGTLEDPMDLVCDSDGEPEDPEERARRVRAGREMRIPDMHGTTHYLGALANTGDIAMVFRSQLIAILHMIVTDDDIRVVNWNVQGLGGEEYSEWIAVWKHMGGVQADRRSLQMIAEKLKAVADQGEKHVLPLYKSNPPHWRVLMVDPTTMGVYLFDPLGHPFTEAECEAITMAYVGYEVVDLRFCVQDDSWNCGIYAAWVLEVWKGAGAAPTVDEQVERLKNGMRVPGGGYREKALQLRQGYKNMLLNISEATRDRLAEPDGGVERASEILNGPRMHGGGNP